MPRIRCRTFFDITRTGVTGFFRQEKLPFDDDSGKRITNRASWTLARNQFRNFEAILQILSLRTQVFDVSTPTKNNEYWEFEFSVDGLAVYSKDSLSDLDVLKSDANSVPMLVFSDVCLDRVVLTDVHSTDPNVVFEIIAP